VLESCTTAASAIATRVTGRRPHPDSPYGQGRSGKAVRLGYNSFFRRAAGAPGIPKVRSVPLGRLPAQGAAWKHFLLSNSGLRPVMTTKFQEPRLDWVMCASASGTHRMAYWEWGDPDNDQVLMCVHGLTRTGRDFDRLAQRLAGRYRVVAPDVVGRGRSDWLIDPAAYAIAQYVADMLVLIARLEPARLDWVGTS